MICETIEKFISAFGKEFGSLLMKPPKEKFNKNPNRKFAPLAYKNFVIYLPEFYHSDWDIACIFDSDKVSKKTVLEIENFVRSFNLLCDVGLLLSFSNNYSHIWHNPNSQYKLHTLPFMGYMNTESKNPFFDLHVGGIKNELIKNIYKDKTDVELINWLILTAWRKFKKGQDISGFIKTYICPNFVESCQSIILNPKQFFKNENPNIIYRNPVKFLNGQT